MQQSESLKIDNLKVAIGGTDILKGINFSLGENSSVGIVGESGSGKTMLVRSLIGLLPQSARASGEYQLSGRSFDIAAKENKWRAIRGTEIGMVMQDPFTALDPMTKCGKQISSGVPKEGLGRFNLADALAEVGLSADAGDKYPFELSGGMRQRVVIAATLAGRPRILIADEATTALDVITQKEILDLIDMIRTKRAMPFVLITHDIRLVRERTENIVVMENGLIVESGSTEEVITNPQNDYTKKLLAADRFLGYDLPAHESEAIEKTAESEALLSVQNVTKRFGSFTAIDSINIEVDKGEIVGIVGQSGSGKTTLARCIVGLETQTEGKISYRGKSHPQIVFQDPYSSLNPAHTAKYTLTEALKVSGEPIEMLDSIVKLAEISAELLDRKPSALSGGQRQRVAIARALAPEPDLLICDESVSALDVVTQNQILATIKKLREERGLAILFITHDLSVVRALADRIYVMNESKIVEQGSTDEVFENSEDPYTARLIEASEYGVG